MIDIRKIKFRKLLVSDLMLMLKWLNTGFVNQWYGKRQYTYSEILDKYGNRINGDDPTNSYLIFYDNTPIGYIQAYQISDYPDYNKYAQVDENTAGVDLFIGEDNYIHKGFGTVILTKFLREVVFSKDSIVSCVVGPEPKNKVAIRCYEKVGFRYFKTIYLPEEKEPEYLMHIKKENLIDENTFLSYLKK